tara:strand:- start:17 stop:259 length:243 start_codon:yes stop_codon:yes gene_type:complete
MDVESLCRKVYEYISKHPNCEIHEINIGVERDVGELCRTWEKNYTSFFDHGRIISRDGKWSVVEKEEYKRMRNINKKYIL